MSVFLFSLLKLNKMKYENPAAYSFTLLCVHAHENLRLDVYERKKRKSWK